jgi:membrane protease YdiL (CAAX protease family)
MTDSGRKTKLSVIRDVREVITDAAAPRQETRTIVWRRRIVVVTAMVLGAAVLSLAMRQAPGEPAFFWLTLALAAVWVIGALASGPLHLGAICWRGRSRRPVLSGALIGLLLGGVFVVGGLIVREIAVFDDLVTQVLRLAEQGPLLLFFVILALNAIAEEMFFRGALFSALRQRYPVIISTVVYLGVVMAGGNVMLGFASISLGTVCAVERRATGGVLAPALTHLVWSSTMVLVLPLLFEL